MKPITIDCIIGIDPGASGGLAIWRPNHKTEVIKMPKNILDLREYFDHMTGICNPIIFLEKVQLRHDDINEHPGKAFRVQKMLQSFEQLKTVITLSGIPFAMVHPIKWQNELKLRVKGEKKKERKERYKNAAAKYYPDITATLWNADALMLVHFGRYILSNNPEWVLEALPKELHYKLF